MPDRTGAALQLKAVDHPAALAWSQLFIGRASPQFIIPVGRRAGSSRHSAAYRLVGVGENGDAIVAKKCLSEEAYVERTIYERVLKHLPLRSPRFFGMIDDGDGRSSWMFLEDVGDDPYSLASPDHRHLAGNWLGALHTQTAVLVSNVPLPDRGPAHYLGHLRFARDTILENLDNPVLDRTQGDRLRGVVSTCDLVESEWSRIEHFCHGMPATLVHGDFIGKNVRVRNGIEGAEIAAFDWGEAGRGIPAVDLAQATFASTSFLSNPDLDSYLESARWTTFTRESVQLLGVYGTIFRCLAALSWESRSLPSRFVEWPVKNMALYDAELVAAMCAAGWSRW